ncbi:MAG: hypothetical protein KAR45_21990, partial [Desulfobacteraceae bacterium]|nr:hypothetical protein [Desulfobacteraceae bacterium]
MSQVENITEMIRCFAVVKGIISKKDARQSLGLTVEQVSSAFATLIKQGYLRRIKRGLYQFTEFVEKPGLKINDKIWKAMKISSSFSISDIIKLTDSTSGYVYNRFREYRADGYIKEAGVRRTIGSKQEKIWRLTLKGKEKAQKPNISAYKPDPLVMAVVNLNRLVCSGLAIRSKESADQAMVFMEEIKKGLE